LGDDAGAVVLMTPATLVDAAGFGFALAVVVVTAGTVEGWRTLRKMVVRVLPRA
jgi:hypothetical protein